MTQAVKLSEAQETWLVMVRWARGGYSAGINQPTLCALARRGMVEARHCRSGFDRRRWYATRLGNEWVDNRDASRRAENRAQIRAGGR